MQHVDRSVGGDEVDLEVTDVGVLDGDRTLEVAEALPLQPEKVTGDSMVLLSLMVKSVPLVCGVQVPTGLTVQVNDAVPVLCRAGASRSR